MTENQVSRIRSHGSESYLTGLGLFVSRSNEHSSGQRGIEGAYLQSAWPVYCWRLPGQEKRQDPPSPLQDEREGPRPVDEAVSTLLALHSAPASACVSLSLVPSLSSLATYDPLAGYHTFHRRCPGAWDGAPTRREGPYSRPVNVHLS